MNGASFCEPLSWLVTVAMMSTETQQTSLALKLALMSSSYEHVEKSATALRPPRSVSVPCVLMRNWQMMAPLFLLLIPIEPAILAGE